jgi:FlaG/FlaF family flagellin (archaellin)
MANNGKLSSITQKGKVEPFDLQVARGQIYGHSTVNIYGFQPTIATTQIPAWELASAYTYPTAATLMNLVSSDAGDTTATVVIQGLDANFEPISEVLALDGTTDVVTTKQYLRINAMAVRTGNPAGAITLKDPTNTTTYARINAFVGRTQMSIYTVPAGYTFYLSRINVYTSLNGSSADFITYRNLSVSNPSGVRNVTQQAPFTNVYEARRVMPRPFTEKTDIQLQVRASAGTAAVSISAEGYLIKNSADAGNT